MSELALQDAESLEEVAVKGWRTAVVWLAVLPASSVGVIVSRAALHREPAPWLAPAGVAMLALLTAVAFTLEPWRPLRGSLLSLTAFAAGGLAADGLAATIDVHDRVARMFLNTSLNLIPCALLVLSLAGSGLTRRDVFLSRGDLAAPARTPWGMVSWRRLGPIITLVLAGGLAAQLTLTLRPDLHMVGRALHALPLAVAFSALNAAQEELRFRAVLLGRLAPAVGSTQALLATSLLFGLEHWFGNPPGPSGVLLAGMAGWVWGRSMLDTRGSAWAWGIHAVQDVVIFCFLVAARG